MITYTDDTPMPWGGFKDVKLGNIPAWYLIKLYENERIIRGNEALKKYIADKLPALKQQKKNSDQQNRR